MGENVDGLACNLERLLDKVSPELPSTIRDSELCFHLMNFLPERVVLQLLPKETFVETIAKEESSALFIK